MKRFAATEQWNDEIANKFRERFLEKFGVDLDEYIPQSESDFEAKWQLVEKAAFGDVELFESFDEKYIHKKVSDIIAGVSDGQIIFNAVNRYEFYEPDIWIGTAYTIWYLEANKELRELDVSQIMTYGKEKNVEEQERQEKQIDALYKEDQFGHGFLKFLKNPRSSDIFSFIFDTKNSILPKSAKDVTRWTWLKILTLEKDKFRSKLQLEDTRSKGKNLSSLIKLEDYILFLRLTSGELVRRIVPLFWDSHGIKLDIKFDMVMLMRLCEIESFSWQILLVEIKRQLEMEDKDIFPIYLDSDIDPTPAINKCIKLLERISEMLEEDTISIINEKRKFLVKAMIYLYICQQKKKLGQHYFQKFRRTR